MKDGRESLERDLEDVCFPGAARQFDSASADCRRTSPGLCRLCGLLWFLETRECASRASSRADGGIFAHVGALRSFEFRSGFDEAR